MSVGKEKWSLHPDADCQEDRRKRTTVGDEYWNINSLYTWKINQSWVKFWMWNENSRNYRYWEDAERFRSYAHVVEDSKSC